MPNLLSFMPYVVAIAGIFGPSIFDFAKIKSQERLKKLELYYQNQFQVYKRFTETYGGLYQNDTYEKFWDFSSAAHHAMVISTPETSKEIARLIGLVKVNLRTNAETDMQFEQCAFKLREEYMRSDKNSYHG